MILCLKKAKGQLIISWCLFIIIFLCLAVQPPYACSDVKYQPKQLRVSYFSSHPYGWQDKDNIHQGVGPDLARLLIHAAAKEAEIIFSPSSSERNIHQLLSGKADLLYHPEEARLRENAVAVIKLGYIPVEILTLSTSNIATLEGIKGRRVASMVRHKEHPLLDNVDLIVTPVDDRLLAMLIAGRVDAVVGYTHSLTYQYKHLKYKNKDFDHYLIDTIGAYLWTHKDSVVAKDLAYWRGIARKKNSPQVFQALIDKYLNE